METQPVPDTERVQLATANEVEDGALTDLQQLRSLTNVADFRVHDEELCRTFWRMTTVLFVVGHQTMHLNVQRFINVQSCAQSCATIHGMNTDLAAAVAARRAELGESVSAIADRANISRATWHNVEQGIGQAITLRTLAAIDNVLGWAPGEARRLFRGDNPGAPKMRGDAGSIDELPANLSPRAAKLRELHRLARHLNEADLDLAVALLRRLSDFGHLSDSPDLDELMRSVETLSQRVAELTARPAVRR